MLLLDVNILIYAMREDSNRHSEYKHWLEEKLTSPETVGISELTLSALLRITTNHRIFERPSTSTQALDFCRAVLAGPAVIRVRPRERHWSIFERLVEQGSVRGNAIPDAYLAALALETNATWVTRDRGFCQFPGLRLLDPLSD